MGRSASESKENKIRFASEWKRMRSIKDCEWLGAWILDKLEEKEREGGEGEMRMERDRILLTTRKCSTDKINQIEMQKEGGKDRRLRKRQNEKKKQEQPQQQNDIMKVPYNLLSRNRNEVGSIHHTIIMNLLLSTMVAPISTYTPKMTTNH